MKTCLIVDDTVLDRKLISTCATKLGLEVIAVSNAEEALNICNQSLPNLILLDWEMKDMNGIELLKKLREMEGGRALPIVICSTHQHASFVGHAHIAGANGYISKPVSAEKLEAKLRELGVI
jgi:two-component system, chemotaxis family, chemotaxis protein CheY